MEPTHQYARISCTQLFKSNCICVDQRASKNRSVHAHVAGSQQRTKEKPEDVRCTAWRERATRCAAEWHSFVNRDKLKWQINTPLRSFDPEARETAPEQLLATARTLASEQLLGGKKLQTSFQLIRFGSQKPYQKPKRSEPQSCTNFVMTKDDHNVRVMLLGVSG